MIESIIENYNLNIDHALQVRNYSLMMFSAINKVYRDFSDKDMEYLKAAALLHDIGYSVEKKSHHKHSLELIKDMDLDGFSEYEKLIIANIARYHRASLPDVSRHSSFAELKSDDRSNVTKLASILRIADGLDKPHKNLIINIGIDIDEYCMTFQLKTMGFLPKLEMAEIKSDLMKKIYNLDVKFVCY